MSSEEKLYLKLKKRWILTCKILPLEEIHPGAGRGVISIAKPDLIITRRTKNPNSLPIIPGSSLKGAFRATLSRILNSLDLDVLNEYGFKISEKELESIEKEFQNLESKEKIAKLREIGTVDKLFGISGFASPIKFTDAVISGKVNPSDAVRERQHIKVNLNTDTTENLFTIESVVLTLVFKFRIIFDELDSPIMTDVNKLFATYFIDTLKKGITLFLGGFKSRGYGYVLVKVDKVESYTPDELLLGKIGGK